jgi:hypothetical protein
VGDGLSALASDGPSPHLQGFPASEAEEEAKRFYFAVEGLLLSPLSYIDEVLWFSSHILAKPLATNCVVLEIGLSLMISDRFKIHQFQLIDIFLISPHQV